MAISQQVVCSECNYSKSTEELFWDLSLEYSSGGSVSSQLEHFMKVEEGIEWKCSREGCASNTASIKHCLIRSPKILVLQLKRFAMVDNE